MNSSLPYTPNIQSFDNIPIDPDDWSLALAIGVEVDVRILQIWKRFYNLNWLQDFGNQCFLISALTRRILRLHGIPAYTCEMITHYSNDKKQWYQRVGSEEEMVHGGTIDTHRVVVSNGLILDWAHRDSVHRQFGAMSPRGFIGDFSQIGMTQDLGFFGKVKWEHRQPHRISKNIAYFQKEDEIALTRFYFENYAME